MQARNAEGAEDAEAPPTLRKSDVRSMLPFSLNSRQLQSGEASFHAAPSALRA